MSDELGTPIQGYSRADVDQFLAAAAEERIRLEAEIGELQGRIGRARAAIGMHRVMVAMLLETQRDLTDVRDAAHAHAEQIVRDAEDEAAALRGALPSPSAVAQATAADGSIDLVADQGAVAAVVAAAGHPSVAEADAPNDDDYMDFLRGALSDDSPLGPVGE